MKPLIKLVLTLFAGFAVLMGLVRLTGLVTLETIETWLETAGSISPLWVAGLVVLLLVVDLFISVPTLALTMLAGFFLGHAGGAAAVLVGLFLAAVLGYGLGRAFGGRVLALLVRRADERAEAEALFRRHGFVMVVLARAVPMFPEVTSCLAGMLHMRLGRFLLAWALGSVPYVFAASYAGSISSLDNPSPAIIAAIAISGVLWLSWLAHHRLHKRRAARST